MRRLLFLLVMGALLATAGIASAAPNGNLPPITVTNVQILR